MKNIIVIIILTLPFLLSCSVPIKKDKKSNDYSKALIIVNRDTFRNKKFVFKDTIITYQAIKIFKNSNKK